MLVSVVIPSSRRARLTFALEALAAQSLPVDRFEVIVVLDPVAPLLPGPDIDGLEPAYVQGTAGGNIAALRNAGWQAARGELIAFTDDDCRPSPDWLEQLVAAYRPGAIVQGATEPDPDELGLLHGLARSQSVRPPSPNFQTCNMLYARTTLEQLGGFDERFAALGEDTDLGLRAVEAGHVHVAAPKALVHHAVIARTPAVAVREAWRRDSFALVVRHHPVLRDSLPYRCFYRRTHAQLLLAVAGLMFGRRRIRTRTRLLLAAPYLSAIGGTTMVSPARLARRLAHVPLRALVDAVEIAAAVRGAIRWRTPVA